MTVFVADIGLAAAKSGLAQAKKRSASKTVSAPARRHSTLDGKDIVQNIGGNDSSWLILAQASLRILGCRDDYM